MMRSAGDVAERARTDGLAARLWTLVERHRAWAVIAVLALLPWILPYEALAVRVLVYGLFALGFNMVFGYMGNLSFGHAALFGSGAYATGISVVHFGFPWYAAMATGVLAGAAAAALIGALAVRTRGIYFAMVTLALSQVLYFVVYQASDWSGGEDGLRGVEVHAVQIGPFVLDLLDPVVKYYFLAVFVAAAVLLFSRMLASPFGAVLEALRENEHRALACGIDVRRTRWIAFTLSGAFCGLAGALYAVHLSIVPIETLHYFTSGEVVMMSLLGGMGTFFGPFFGAALFLVLEDVITVYTEHWQLVVGALFVLLILFFPRGVWGSILHWLEGWLHGRH